MFKMFKALVTSKASDMSNFSTTFEEINKSKAIMEINSSIKEEEYNILFEEGMFFLKKFTFSENQSEDTNLLHQSAIRFTKALELKQSKADNYFYLAYIFYLMKEVSLALNYLKVVTTLDPSFKGLEELKNRILENQNLTNIETKSIQKNIINQTSIKPIKTIQRVRVA